MAGATLDRSLSFKEAAHRDRDLLLAPSLPGVCLGRAFVPDADPPRMNLELQYDQHRKDYR
jgi:hypothetical protein